MWSKKIVFFSKIILMVLLSTFSGLVLAQETITPATAMPAQPNQAHASLVQGSPAAETQLLDDAQLVANPVLLVRVLDRAVETESWGMVRHLLSLEVQRSSENEVLYSFAQARLAHVEGHYAQAIKVYREILSKQPELTPVRLHLAKALFENGAYEAAVYQFNRARTDQPPEPVVRVIDAYLDAIAKNHQWRFNAGLNYINDNNINNASNDRFISIKGKDTGLKLSDDSLPQSGRGLSYNLNVERDFFLTDHHAITASLDVTGKSYWNNPAFDDTTIRTGLGYQWRNATRTFTLQPFYQPRWYAGKRYSKTYGARVSTSYLVTPAWQIYAAAEIAENRYRQRDFLNGHYQFLSLGSSFAFNSKTWGFWGVDVMKNQTNDRSESSLRSGLRVGLTREFGANLSAQLQASVANRLFAQNGFFGIRRQDREHRSELTIWNRQWYVWGVMPKLNLS
jgi:outer membrane protein